MTRTRNRNTHTRAYSQSILARSAPPYSSRFSNEGLPSTATKSQDPASSYYTPLAAKRQDKRDWRFSVRVELLDDICPFHDRDMILPLPIRVTPDDWVKKREERKMCGVVKVLLFQRMKTENFIGRGGACLCGAEVVICGG